MTTTTNSSADRREVSFWPHVRVRTTLHLRDYTKNEIQACWFNEKERKAIKEDANKECKRIWSAKFDETLKVPQEEVCGRGLEFQRNYDKELRCLRRKVAFQAVDREQQSQKVALIKDEIKIAAVYSKKTRSSRLQARRVGERDYRDSLQTSGHMSDTTHETFAVSA